MMKNTRKELTGQPEVLISRSAYQNEVVFLFLREIRCRGQREKAGVCKTQIVGSNPTGTIGKQKAVCLLKGELRRTNKKENEK